MSQQPLSQTVETLAKILYANNPDFQPWDGDAFGWNDPRNSNGSRREKAIKQAEAILAAGWMAQAETPVSDIASDANSAFTRAHLAEIRRGARLRRDFETFLIERFMAYTQARQVIDLNRRPVRPVTLVRDAAGFGHWRLPVGWDTHDDLDADDEVLVEHYMADDRGPGRVDVRVLVPWSFVFGEDEVKERYAQYLALKAEFEPTRE